MKTQIDPHDARKAEIEDSMIQTAELKAQEAEKYIGIGKAAYEGARTFILGSPAILEQINQGAMAPDWNELDEDWQCAWVEAAKAAVRADKENSAR